MGHSPTISYGLFLLCGFAWARAATAADATRPPEPQAVAGGPAITGLAFDFQTIVGIGLEPGVCRRDPSDVIRVGETYYVYYTKVAVNQLPPNWRQLYPSGYVGTVWYATSSDGLRWTECGEALGRGKQAAFDSHAVFTPNILVHRGRYWLYYTGVRSTPGRDDDLFENNSTNDFTAIGVAVGDSPSGPFTRVSLQPVLRVSENRDFFDSYRVDDACLLVQDGKVWLYYKGRSLQHGRAGPGRTQMGVAVADSPAGPFEKLNGGRPVQDSGHEVQIWRQDGQVMSLVSPTGPSGRSLQSAADGLDFRVVLRGLRNMPSAPGLYRPELTDNNARPSPPEWGISMVHGRDPYLIRYGVRWTRP